MKADYFAYTLLAIYVLATLAYLFEGNWPKFMYFAGSAIITIGIMMTP
jgi:drug/metabolite transporter (DMT)-like permease